MLTAPGSAAMKKSRPGAVLEKSSVESPRMVNLPLSAKNVRPAILK